MPEHSIVTNSPAETQNWAEQFTQTLSRGSVVALIGELGAGKTVIAKAIGRALGIRDEIISPTFNYVLEYDGEIPLYHADLYRLDSSREFHALGLDEYFNGNGIFLIEWAERIESILPLETIYIKIESGREENQRKITVSR